MAEQQTEQDRTEPATPTKLRDARRRGQVAKSLEINSLFVLTLALCAFLLLGQGMVARQLALSRSLLAGAHRFTLDPAQAVALFEVTFHRMVAIFWPFMAGLVIVAVLMNMAQTGPVFSFFPLKPDPSRVNPVTGFKRLFSAKLLFESLKTLIKIGLFAGVLYFAVAGLLPSLVGLLDRHPDTYPAYLGHEGFLIALKLMAVLVLIALFDLLYTRWDYAKRLRMSRREIKEEVKRREGDPQVRARIRALQREAARRAGALRRVPEADVLITNPTHVAVALSYRRGEMAAPTVIAKGAGDLALRMRETARGHRVPVVENKALARQLFRSVEIDRPIGEAHYPAVAAILVRVFAQRDARAGTAAGV